MTLKQRLLSSTPVVLLVGKSGRLDCLADALHRSAYHPTVITLSEVDNPGLASRSAEVVVGRTEDPAFVVDCAKKFKPDFAIIGPEEPLAAGVVDALNEIGVPSVGPTKRLARLESSKGYARHLMKKYQIPGNPEFRTFDSTDGLSKYLDELGEFVVKPDGLTGGKGVKVIGDHFQTVGEGFDYARDLLRDGINVIIEEKLEGEEFSYQSFCDGNVVKDMVPVQDHKRAFVGDLGPNTGGMGTYSCEDHSLPFLSDNDLQTASEINRRMADALRRDNDGEGYRGIIYGGFMATPKGLRVIEFNARFGDPEAMNVLAILETDFVDICRGIIEGTLDEIDIRFAKKATVCKYVVPNGYPDQPLKGAEIKIGAEGLGQPGLHTHYGAVYNDGTKLRMTGSRAIAFTGVARTVWEAENIAERAANSVRGPVYHREDIGRPELIQRRIDHMNELRAKPLVGRRRVNA